MTRSASLMARLCQALLLVALVLFVFSEAQAEQSFDALVSKAERPRPQGTDALPRFATVNGALNAGYSSIAIASGEYYEKVTVNRDHVALIGVGEQKPRIYFDAYAGESGAYHRDEWGTPGSATMTINAVGVRLHNIRVDNSFDFLANDALAKDHPQKRRHSQAVALLLDVDSDLTHISASEFHGFQDTVFADGGRTLFEHSLITGNVDYIFGDGLAVFADCEIRTMPRGREYREGELQGYITAPSTNIDQPYGLVFINARLTRDEQVHDGSISLGRPWHPTTTFADGRYADPDAIGSALFVDSELGAHILAEGWSSMRGTARDGTKSRVFTPAESRFFESQNRGPGAQKHAERKQLSESQRVALKKFVAELKAHILAVGR
ncbi:pectinesterase family protein [Gilvimarinus sp. SDUM040013]|uniref:Pectinesterase family protein n=1 Tax=Gilvimarinus gilvus TaxID=3058038 RepID=A0ABU4RY84_9GAMM|nr:pectinesterase family protein [Gilvimarinus sp. SDUM040013]MDO3386250.1 pectinesterase family protein [Gilvimarinus sp. SDUM040013]MDX6849755.1 pectinesterase family protein [Gilvimarinus sp. SDUM040013]